MCDNTALMIVLPSIVAERDVGEVLGRLLFVALMLANLAVLPAASGLAARIGRRGSYQWGLATFAAGSLLVALDGPFWLLLFGRVLQGSGGALMLPNAAGLLEASMPREHYARGVATWVTVGSSGIFVGPLLGGFVADRFNWPIVFVIEAIIALIGLWMTRSLENVIPRYVGKVDFGGMVLGGVGVSLGCLTVLEIGQPEPAWSLVLAGLVLGGFALTWFVRHERRVATPAVDFAVLRTPGLGGLLTGCLFYNAAASGLVYVLSLNLQRDQGFSASHAAWVILLMMALHPLGGHLAGRIKRGVGFRLIMASMILSATFAIGALGMTTAAPATVLLLAGTGAAMGLLFASETVATLELTPSVKLISALANLSLSRHVGSVVGIAVLGTIHEQIGHSVSPGANVLAATFLLGSLAILPSIWVFYRHVTPALSRARGPDAAVP